MAKSISILGCGWLGFPLAKCLVKSGWQVKGSTTELKKMKELKAAGIDPFMIKLGENPSLCSADIFLDSEYLIVNVPPSKGMKTKEDIEQLINLIKLSTVVITSYSIHYTKLYDLKESNIYLERKNE